MKLFKPLLLIILVIFCCCSDEFLDQKTDKTLTVPSSLADYWALLDNRDIMQFTPAIGQLASDDQYFRYETWNTLDAPTRYSYIWSDQMFDQPPTFDWSTPYSQVYYANCVLEGIENIERNPGNQQQWDHIKGTALFLRAYAFYNLAEIYGKPFSANASNDPGIPLRLTSDLTVKSEKGNLQQTYDQIIGDLTLALDLVPEPRQQNLTRPSKPAVAALLARIFLSIGNYDKALTNADAAIGLYGSLLDYNTVNVGSNNPFNDRPNPEVLYESALFNYFALSARSNTLVDMALFQSYADEDLRKRAFYRTNSSGAYYFKGRYTRLNYPFSGLAMDELYLIRAECRARKGEIQPAMDDLNFLLQNRWREGYFTPLVANSVEEAMIHILGERRKELVFRGLRWSDIRRLSGEPEYRIVPRRLLNGTEYILEANSKRYVFPIPLEEINQSGIEQNEK